MCCFVVNRMLSTKSVVLQAYSFLKIEKLIRMQIRALRVLENTCLFVDRWKTVRAPDKWSLYSEYSLCNTHTKCILGKRTNENVHSTETQVRWGCSCFLGTEIVEI